MGIWNRLGNVIKSYLNDDESAFLGRGADHYASGDPDLDAAFEELNDYLKGKTANSGRNRNQAVKLPPDSLRPDFAELEVAFGASSEECKAAYKRLLKICHPDRHATHADNFKKATERTARLNAAYDRIEKWRTGRN
jgi:DnaJ-domain-containing protein 1